MNTVKRIMLLVGLVLFGCDNVKVEKSKYWVDSTGVKVFAHINGACDATGYFTGERIVWYKSRSSDFKIVVSDEQIKDGFRHGLIREKSNESIYLSNYINGKRNGKYLMFGKDGQLLIRANFKSGKLSGRFSRWYDNGVLSKQAEFSDGVLHGKMYSWWSNGKLLKIENFLNGLLKGEQWEWDENGRVVFNKRIKATKTIKSAWTYQNSDVVVSTTEIAEKCDNTAIVDVWHPKKLKRVMCGNYWDPQTIDYFSFMMPPCWESEIACECFKYYGQAPEMFSLEK